MLLRYFIKLVFIWIQFTRVHPTFSACLLLKTFEDVVFALTDSKDPRQYIRRMKQHDLELKKGWVQIVHTLSIETAGELTDEWKNRQINEQRDYSILTAEISKATFNMTPSEYKKFKRLKRNSRHSIR